MKFMTPDHALRECFVAEEAAFSPSRSIAMHGRDYDWLCPNPKCRKHKTVEAWCKDSKNVVLRCAHCGKGRPWKDASVLPGHVS